MKVCSKCKSEKPRTDFYVRRDRPDGRQSRCKSCTNAGRWEKGRFRSEEEKQRVYAANRRSYRKHAEKYKTRSNQRNAQMKLSALDAAGTRACIRCGFDTHPAALEFHHRDSTTKKFNVSSAVVSPDKYPWDLVVEEIGKCDVICANCHKIEHNKRSYDDGS